MKKRILTTTIALTMFTCVFITATHNVMAQAAATTNTGGQALEIAPPVITLSVDPGQTVTAKISVRNISGGKLYVTGQLNDFVAAGEDGTPKILMDDDQKTEKNPYSIIDWISPMPKLTLSSKQIESIPVTITVPKNASPGGHYGVVRFSGVPPELKSTGVSLSASLGSLILVRVSGDIKNELSVSDFSVSKNGAKNFLFETAPLVITEKFKNTGNIHEQPSGLVTITDMFGKKLATLGVNATAPQGNILPGSTRSFKQDLNDKIIGNKMLFGRYTAVLKLTYGTGKVINQTIVFWVIPYTMIAIGIAILVGGFIILRISIKRYNQAIINKAQGIKKQPKVKKIRKIRIKKIKK